MSGNKAGGTLKKLRLLLAATVALSVVLSGCSSGEADKASTATGNKSGSLKVEIFDRGNTPQGYTITDSYLTRYAKENFGKPNDIDLTYVPVQRSEEVTKLNVLMASGGDVPDIVFTYDSGTFERYAEQGGLTDLTPLLNEYGPNLKKFLGEDTLSYGQVGGKQFAIPGKRTILGKYSSFIRQDWLDTLNMPVPKTTDELYNTLKAFKEKDPGKTGGKVVPLGMTMEPGQYDPLLWSFIKPVTDEQKYTLTQELGSRDYPILLPGFKDGVQFMNKLYNENLISKDFGLDKDKKQLTQDIQSGNTGFFSEDYDNIYYNDSAYPNLLANQSTAKLTPMDPYTNSEGKHAKPEFASNGLYIMVPKSSEHAIEAIKYLDWMSSEKVLLDMQNGVEGENYTLKDGIPVAKEKPTQEAQDRIYNQGDVVIIANGKIAGDDNKNKEAFVLGMPAQFQEDVRKAMDISNTDTISPVKFDHPIKAESKYSNSLLDKFDEMVVKSVMVPPAQFDATFEAALKDYMVSGGQAILDERTEAYKAMTGK
ncbi:extracellular solute-binding protein [Paenibacillus polymyxa]|uniref:extracellular solute-binding protein n=1 Tax=Paenibacillus polymyxa TaxID=1406 RepID=UPI00046F7252|nr:extracellular solute-binding protein [Paenibacillus polymyxa]WCM63111.1 extracellular solute-binding protein [Paenibacillus polymyxa]